MAMTPERSEGGTSLNEEYPTSQVSQLLGDETQQKWAGGPATHGLAQALGWFSIGLGLAEIAAPGAVSRLIGIRDDDSNRNLVRMLGVREMVSGIGILTQSQPTGWVWSRVAGDVMDLSLLGNALSSEDSQRDRVAMAAAAVAGVTALDLLCSDQLSRVGSQTNGRAHHEHDGILRVRAMTVNTTPEVAYSFWRDFSNFPRFMQHLESVEVLDDRRSRWRTEGPIGRSYEWEAEITEDRPNELIAWRSLPGSDVQNSGCVRFDPAPGERGTEVRVELQYSPPGGGLGATIAGLFGKEPKQQLQDDMRRFKQVLETGVVVQSSASLGGLQFPQLPAQPLAEAA